MPRAERLKLLAATLNNLGCLFQRRGKFRSALGYLEKALRVESGALPPPNEVPEYVLVVRP